MKIEKVKKFGTQKTLDCGLKAQEITVFLSGYDSFPHIVYGGSAAEIQVKIERMRKAEYENAEFIYSESEEK